MADKKTENRNIDTAKARGERTAKYNQLLRIEEELKESARYGKAEIIRKKGAVKKE